MREIKNPEEHHSAIKTTGSVFYRRHRKNRVYVYVVIALSITLLWSLPKPFYENIQKRFVVWYSRVFMNHAEVSSTSCSIQDTENIILKDRIAILEERLQAYEVAYHTPLCFQRFYRLIFVS